MLAIVIPTLLFAFDAASSLTFSGAANMSCSEVQRATNSVLINDAASLLWSSNDGVSGVLLESFVGISPADEIITSLALLCSSYVMLPSGRTSDGNDCLYMNGFEIIRTETIETIEIPKTRAKQHNISTNAGGILGPATSEALTILGVKGVDYLLFEFVPFSQPQLILDSNTSCSSCPVTIRELRYEPEKNLITTYLKRGKKLELIFNPSFTEVISFLSPILKITNLLEVLEVHGGTSWGDPGILLDKNHFKYLRVLDLGGNGLTNIQDENFRNVPELQELCLRKNNFKFIPRGISFLSNLTLLDISENPIDPRSLKNVLANTTKLMYLNVSGIPLRNMEHISLENELMITNLEVLDASRCSLDNLNSNLAIDFFMSHLNLREVFLAGNPLRSISTKTFKTLKYLELLDLSQTQLQVGPLLEFSPGLSLRVLDLSLNNLTSPENVLAASVAAYVEPVTGDLLDLSGNPLGLWKRNDIFKAFRSVNLSFTGLITFTPAMIQSLSKLDSVDLGGNPIDCTVCSTPDIQEWLKSSSETNISILGTNSSLLCTYPKSEYGRPVIMALTENIHPCDQELEPEKGMVLVSWVLGSIAIVLLIIFACVVYCCCTRDKSKNVNSEAQPRFLHNVIISEKGEIKA